MGSLDLDFTGEIERRSLKINSPLFSNLIPFKY